MSCDIEIKVQTFRFATIEEIKEISEQELLKSMFQECFGDWKKRWH